MKKISKWMLLVWFFFLLLAATLAFFENVKPSVVQAGVSCKAPNIIPARQNSNGKCGCTNEHGLANGWTEDSTCGDSEVVVVKVTNTIPPQPKETIPPKPKKATETAVPEDPADPPIVPTMIIPESEEELPKQDLSDAKADPAPELVTVLPTSATCDLCQLEERKVTVMERIATVLEKLVNWITR